MPDQIHIPMPNSPKENPRLVPPPVPKMNYDTVLPDRIRAKFEHKRNKKPRKWIAIGLIAVGLSGVGVWQLSEYQNAQRREQFMTWVAKYRPGWNDNMIKKQWEKVEYARTHTSLVPTPTPTPQPIADPVLRHSLELLQQR